MRFNNLFADLSYILKQNEVRHIIICPGSRNAPLTQLFSRDPDFSCHSIVDERSAAYVALGMSKQLNEPVVVLTTSGTATLNLAPAIAEAFFQQIPLIVLTADRPPEWPPQFSNQIVNQAGTFRGNSKKYYSLAADFEDKTSYNEAIGHVNETIFSANDGKTGPVHVNILLTPPLYQELAKEESVSPHIGSGTQEVIKPFPSSDMETISVALKQQKKVLLIAGASPYTEEEVLILQSLVAQFNVVVLAENIANLHSDFTISQAEIVLASLGKNQAALKPDLILTFGGQVVSKYTRLFVQALIEIPVLVMDTLPGEVLKELIGSELADGTQEYLSTWKNIEEGASEMAGSYMENAPFSNLTAMHVILKKIPENAVVHLGNSGSIRYSQLCPSRSSLSYYGNRGTSGIDGSLSTAVGAAMVSDSLHVVILGDLSFVYDSNAMWNKDFPSNLRVIVLNDKGGGIFRIIDGPDRMPFFEEFSVTKHPANLKELTLAYGLNYAYSSDYEALNEMLKPAFEKKSEAGIFEVDTSTSENSSIFKGLYKSIQKD